MTVAPRPKGWPLWKYTLHRRTGYAAPGGTIGIGAQFGEALHARSASLVRKLNTPAQLQFSMSGRDPTAALISELATDVMAWRWNELAGKYEALFYGTVISSQDTLSEQVHTVEFTCQDYLAHLQRRWVTTPFSTIGTIDQDQIVSALITNAGGNNSSVYGNGYEYAGQMPLETIKSAPGEYAGNTMPRPASGQLRSRTYPAGQNIGQALSDLAAVIGGFDYQAWPDGNLQIFYPSQGVARNYPLVYGVNVASLTRQVASSSYANYEMFMGATPTDGTAAPTASAWNDDAISWDSNPAGLWMDLQTSADVTDTTTLTEQAQGALAANGILLPSYTLTLRPDKWQPSPDARVTPAKWNMGDVVPLIVKSGRLDVNTAIRIVGITFTIGDDGAETVALDVGLPTQTYDEYFLDSTNARLSALERR